MCTSRNWCPVWIPQSVSSGVYQRLSLSRYRRGEAETASRMTEGEPDRVLLSDVVLRVRCTEECREETAHCDGRTNPSPARRRPDWCAAERAAEPPTSALSIVQLRSIEDFHGENGSVLRSGPIAQGGGGKVHHDRILNFHVADCVHKEAFDPVIRKGESTTLVVFGHGILTEQMRSQPCDRQQLARTAQETCAGSCSLPLEGRLDYTPGHASTPVAGAMIGRGPNRRAALAISIGVRIPPGPERRMARITDGTRGGWLCDSPLDS